MTKIPCCPVVFQKRDLRIPAEFLPVYPGYYKYGRVGTHIEEVEFLGDVLDRLRVEDEYNMPRDTLVLEVRDIATSNVWCGGEVKFLIVTSNTCVSRRFGLMVNSFYISELDGVLRTAFAA